MAKEIKWMTKEFELTPEEAADMLDKLDCSTPLYYTRQKRRDPFEEMLEGGAKDSKRARRWRFWERGS